MGAWGSGPFDNDDAADWSGELNDAEPGERVEMIRAALTRAAQEDDYVELDTAHVAIAAAAVVAAQRPEGTPVESVYAPEFLTGGEDLDLPEEFTELAIRALDRVVSDESEWREQWEDADELSEALAALVPLREGLTG